MKNIKNTESLMAVERERERERVLFIQLTQIKIRDYVEGYRYKPKLI